MQVFFGSEEVKAPGTDLILERFYFFKHWIPACAGMTALYPDI